MESTRPVVGTYSSSCRFCCAHLCGAGEARVCAPGLQLPSTRDAHDGDGWPLRFAFSARVLLWRRCVRRSLAPLTRCLHHGGRLRRAPHL
eukprot:3268652-Prymnesium_polylepis.1